jgi:hypothetical protein
VARLVEARHGPVGGGAGEARGVAGPPVAEAPQPERLGPRGQVQAAVEIQAVGQAQAGARLQAEAVRLIDRQVGAAGPALLPAVLGEPGGGKTRGRRQGDGAEREFPGGAEVAEQLVADVIALGGLVETGEADTPLGLQLVTSQAERGVQPEAAGGPFARRPAAVQGGHQGGAVGREQAVVALAAALDAGQREA